MDGTNDNRTSDTNGASRAFFHRAWSLLAIFFTILLIAILTVAMMALGQILPTSEFEYLISSREAKLLLWRHLSITVILIAIAGLIGCIEHLARSRSEKAYTLAPFWSAFIAGALAVFASGTYALVVLRPDSLIPIGIFILVIAPIVLLWAESWTKQSTKELKDIVAIGLAILSIAIAIILVAPDMGLEQIAKIFSV